MNKTVVLHIGMHKTGTSTLQAMFAENSDWLADQGVLYPVSGRSGTPPHGQHELAWAVTGRRVVAASVWTQLTAEMQKSELNRTLISAEDFSSMSREQIAVVRELLTGFDVRIIAYVRDPFDFMVSAYGQQISSQTAYSRPFRSFVEKNLPRCDYGSLVRNWADAIGGSAVQMRSFDYAKSIGLVNDFCGAMGLLPDNRDSRSDSVRNRSKGNRALSWFRTLNRLEARLPGGRAMRPAIRRLRRLSRFGLGNASAFQTELELLESTVVESTRTAATAFAAEWLPTAHRMSFLRRYEAQGHASEQNS